MHEYAQLDRVGRLTVDVGSSGLVVVGELLIDRPSRSRKKTDVCSSIAGESEATHCRCWAFRIHSGSQAPWLCVVGRYEPLLDEIVVACVGRC